MVQGKHIWWWGVVFVFSLPTARVLVQRYGLSSQVSGECTRGMPVGCQCLASISGAKRCTASDVGSPFIIRRLLSHQDASTECQHSPCIWRRLDAISICILSSKGWHSFSTFFLRPNV